MEDVNEALAGVEKEYERIKIETYEKDFFMCDVCSGFDRM